MSRDSATNFRKSTTSLARRAPVQLPILSVTRTAAGSCRSGRRRSTGRSRPLAKPRELMLASVPSKTWRAVGQIGETFLGIGARGKFDLVVVELLVGRGADQGKNAADDGPVPLAPRSPNAGPADRRRTLLLLRFGRRGGCGRGIGQRLGRLRRLQRVGRRRHLGGRRRARGVADGVTGSGVLVGVTATANCGGSVGSRPGAASAARMVAGGKAGDTHDDQRDHGHRKMPLCRGRPFALQKKRPGVAPRTCASGYS